ncbi:MAG: hypothetical protein QOC92_10 [Acidimicrobiaceae bacterium]|jgi:outer membrane protein assembly factor BamB
MIRRLNLTEGQAYTTAIALTLAVLLTAAGVPAVLRTRTVPARVGVNPLNPRGTQTTGVTPTTTSAALPPSPGVAARPSRPVAAPAPGGATAPGLPPGISGAPAPAPPLLTTTTFARVDHPGAPGGLAVGRDGTVYVTTDNGTAHGDQGPSHVFAFDAKGKQTVDHTIAGQPSEHVRGLTGAALDPVTGHVAVLDPDGARILDIDMISGAQQLLAEIPDLPACLVSLGASPCQQGADDRKPFPVAAAHDARGDLFVTDPTQDTVWRLRRGDQVPEVWYQTPYFAAGDGPYGLAVSDDAVEFTVGTTFDPSAPAAGGLYRVTVNADGTAGALTLAALFARGDEPGPLAVGSSGTAYVVLRSTGAIVAIAPGGAESWRISPPGEGPIPLDTPSALALTLGQLLVANEGAGADPAHWAVLAVAVNDGARQ